MSHNRQKKIAVINDFTGFGRCSIAVSLPIISHLRIQCCPLPTAIFSNHTEYDSFYQEDFTYGMENYIGEWRKLGLTFSGIATGYLNSAEQIRIVKDFITEWKCADTQIVVDPVMGDHGDIYPVYEGELCRRMKELVALSDIVTPNVTEACILTDTPYRENFRKSELISMAEAISAMGPGKVVITGADRGSFIGNLCYEKDQEPVLLRTKRIGPRRAGTGDIFAAVIAADAVNGVDFRTSVRRASRFVKVCILRSAELELPLLDGVCFEEVLYTLPYGR